MNVNVLMYHGFTGNEKAEGIINHDGKHLFIKKFEQQIAFLKKNYQVISISDLISGLDKGKGLGDRCVVLTMDDGYRSNYTLGFPILQKYKVPAAVFVATDFVDLKQALWFDRLEYAFDRTWKTAIDYPWKGVKLHFRLKSRKEKINALNKLKILIKILSPTDVDHMVSGLENALGQSLDTAQGPQIYAPLSWTDIRIMHESGLVTIGSHTCSHAILTRCPGLEMEEQLVLSKKRIEKETGAPCLYFGYPNGGPGDFNAETQAYVKKSGYSAAFVSVIGANNHLSSRYELKRLNIHNSGDLLGFKRTLSGFFRFLRAVKRLAPTGY